MNLNLDEVMENRNKWLAALRSGDYEQGTGRLAEDGKFCCLGVACEVANIPYIGWESLPDSICMSEKYKISDYDCSVLAKLNDGGYSFSEIADYLATYIFVITQHF